MSGQSRGAHVKGLLWDHAACDDAISNKLPRLSDVHLMEFGGDIVLVSEDARNICHQDEFLCLQGSSNLQCSRCATAVGALSDLTAKHIMA